MRKQLKTTLDAIAYYRVSTDKQGKSGLGLEAQQAAVAGHVARSKMTLAGQFIEVESGKSHKNRPQLAAALEECRRKRAVLIIAKLDRLARNVYFIAGLMESGVDFVACDMPDANRLTIHVMASFAEHEARAISDRTKAALAAAQARGIKLGNPRWEAGIEKANKARGLLCYATPAPVLEMMRGLRAAGKTYRAIAAHLNELGITTANGKRWHPAPVRAALLGPEFFAQKSKDGAAETTLEPGSPENCRPAIIAAA